MVSLDKKDKNVVDMHNPVARESTEFQWSSPVVDESGKGSRVVSSCMGGAIPLCAESLLRWPQLCLSIACGRNN
jgi:hypothetical protein